MGVAKVEFSVDEAVASTDTNAPYSFAWDSTAIADGQHVLKAKAYDAAGNSATSAAGTVTVGNADITPPTAPTGLSATAAGPTAVHLTWAASTDNVGVTGYAVMRDGQQIGTTVAASYSDTTVQAATTYTYVVTARDAAGNVSAPSSPATVTTPAEPSTARSVATQWSGSASTRSRVAVAAVSSATSSGDIPAPSGKPNSAEPEHTEYTDTSVPLSSSAFATPTSDARAPLPPVATTPP